MLTDNDRAEIGARLRALEFEPFNTAWIELFKLAEIIPGCRNYEDLADKLADLIDPEGGSEREGD